MRLGRHRITVAVAGSLPDGGLAVSEWARRNKVIYTSYTSLTAHPEVIKLISEEVDKGNQNLARVEQIKKFTIIPQELDPETGDTTPTRKIKRNHLYQMFKGLVEEMYQPEESKNVPNTENLEKGGNYEEEIFVNGFVTGFHVRSNAGLDPRGVSG